MKTISHEMYAVLSEYEMENGCSTKKVHIMG